MQGLTGILYLGGGHHVVSKILVPCPYLLVYEKIDPLIVAITNRFVSKTLVPGEDEVKTIDLH